VEHLREVRYPSVRKGFMVICDVTATISLFLKWCVLFEHG
jgi:hypothetical protein